jgi:hypothetical protein
MNISSAKSQLKMERNQDSGVPGARNERRIHFVGRSDPDRTLHVDASKNQQFPILQLL